MIPPVLRHVLALEAERSPGPRRPGHADFSNLDWGEAGNVARVTAPGILARAAARGRGIRVAGPLLALTADAAIALRLYRSSRRPGVGILEADRGVLLFLLLRSALPSPEPIVLFGFYLHPGGRLRRALLARALGAATVVAVWSFRQRDALVRALRLDPARVFVLPYKANHSREPRVAPPPIEDRIFSGGNSERDYRTLFEAVRTLDVPVVVSATDPRALGGLRPPDNVTLVRAREPEFGRLMASSRLVVLPLTAGRLRGAGEASFLNAMWHGRPVVCADDVSAPEYLEHGVTGWITPPGDPGALREAIRTLWHDRARAEAIGENGRAAVERWFTHARFRERLDLLVRSLGADEEGAAAVRGIAGGPAEGPGEERP